MYKLCKTEQSATRQKLIETALLDKMKSKRFEDISVSELCEALSMPRKAFYRYFESKDGALRALLDHTLADFQHFGSEYTDHEQRSLARDLEQFYLFWLRRREMLDAFEKSNLTGLLIQSSLQYSISDHINPRKFLPEESDWMRSQVFLFAISGLMTSMLEWYRRGFCESTRSMAEAACRMLSAPLFPTLERLGLIEK